MFTTSNALVEEQLIKHHEKPWLTVSHHECDNYPGTKLEVTAAYDLTDGEFNRAVMKKLSFTKKLGK